MGVNVSFIIVNYKNDLSDILHSIKNTVKLQYEIIISNNSSPIDFKDKKVIVIKNKTNLGYGRACNKAIKISKGKYIVIINPDVILQKDTVSELVKFMDENPSVNILAPKLLYPDDSLQYSCRRFPTLKTLLLRNLPKCIQVLFVKDIAHHNMIDTNHNVPMKVDWVSGAFMVFRKKYLFDQNYFMYFEDVDLCRTVGDVWYYPKAIAYHIGSHGSKKKVSLTLAHIRSMIYYFIKW